MDCRRQNLFFRLNIFLLFLFLVFSLGWGWLPSNRVVVLTFNIRYLNLRDGPNAWPFRREKVVNTLKFQQVDIAGLQEVLWPQLNELRQALPEYSWLGVGREDGQRKGEFNPIFYRRERFKVIDWGTFWLAENPDSPGQRGWDAACPRIVTWAKFKIVGQAGEFLCLNTHFDHVGERARRESAHLLKKWLTHYLADKKWPVVLLGDFNSSPDEEPYYILTNNQKEGLAFQDAYQISRLPPYGSSFTFNGFRDEVFPGQRIDYVFVLNVAAVYRCGILSVRWDGRYASDHFPVLAEIELFPKVSIQKPQKNKNN